MQPPSQVQYTQYKASQKTDGAALTALMLAVASFVFWIAPAIVALALAPSAKRRVKASNGATKGLGVALAAQIVAGCSLAIAVLVLAGIGLT
jgi:hypothetical protein